MNILFLTEEGGLTGNTRSTSYLAKGLAKKSHNVWVGCKKDSLLHQFLCESDVNLEFMKFTGKLDFATIRVIRDLVRNKNIQIICPQSSADRYLSIFANKFYKLDTNIVHTRRQKPLSSGGALQRAFYIKNTRKIVVVSDSLKQILIDEGYPADHIEVIYNGIPEDFYIGANDSRLKKLRQKFRLTPENKVVGCISRLKNQKQLVEAMQYLPDDIKLMFVGIEPGKFDSLAMQLKIENEIIYAGIIDPEDVVDYYRLFDLFVLPSTMDGFGLVLVEAMGLGVPVIGTRFGGIIDVLDNQKNGLWFEDGDIKGLAGKIKSVLFDDSIRGELIENGYIAARERFTVQKTIDNWEKFFMRIIEKKA